MSVNVPTYLVQIPTMTVITMEMVMVTEVEMVTKTKMKNTTKATAMNTEAATVTKMKMRKTSITKAMGMTMEAKMTTTTIPEMKPMKILLAQLIKVVV